MLEYPLLLVFPIAMAFAAAMDLLTMTIPNRISLALVAAFAAMAPFSGLSGQEILYHLGAGAGILLLGILLFELGWLGGGDAKLMAAAALWIGTEQLLPFFVMVSLMGGALALTIMAYRYLIPVRSLPVPAWALKLHEAGTGIPYGIAIAGAAMWIYPSTPLFLKVLT